MSRESLVIFCGALVIFVPSFGIPSSWKTYAFVGLGSLLVILGLSLRYSRFVRKQKNPVDFKDNKTFFEHNGLPTRTEGTKTDTSRV